MHCKLVSPDHQIYRLSSIPHTYQDLTQIISQKLSIPQSQPLKLKYQDIDQELITLNNQEDLQTALLTSQSDNLKCLKIYVYSEETKKKDPDPSDTPEAPDKIQQEEAKRGLSRSFFQAKKPENPAEGKSKFFYNVKDHFIVDRRLMRSQLKKAINDTEKLQITKKLPNNQIVPKENQVFCSICKKRISKIQYVCLCCQNTVYCEECEVSSTHDHPLLKMRSKHMNFPLQSTFKDEKYTPKSSIRTSGNPSLSSLTSGNRTSTSSEDDNKGLYKSKFRVQFEQKTVNEEGERVWEFNVILRNTGKQAWPANTKLICINGVCKGQIREIPSLGAKEKIHIKLSLQPTEKINDCNAHLSQWKLHFENNKILKSFGHCFFLKIYESPRKTTTAGVIPTPETKEESKENKEILVQKDVIEEKAETLNVMFPGNLEEKKKFVRQCPMDYDIYMLVDAYLLTLRDMQQRRSFIV